jgi:hypothetical protein
LFEQIGSALATSELLSGMDAMPLYSDFTFDLVRNALCAGWIG